MVEVRVMKLHRQLLVAVACAASLVFGQRARADVFGSGANSFSIDFVTIGNPDNPPDTTGTPAPAGAVPYAYRIGKYEISEQMIDKANALGGLGIGKDSRGADKPATSVNWYEAARFVNWLNASTGYIPAYKFDDAGTFLFWSPSDSGYNVNNIFRNSLSRYFLPSIDEWYKAAFYDSSHDLYWNYPTASDLQPTAVTSGTLPGTAIYGQNGPADITQAGGQSPYGTIAQGGNVAEWMETDNKVSPSARSWRGGAWVGSAGALPSLSFANNVGANVKNTGVGLRVGSVVPEPGSILTFTVTSLAILTAGTRYPKWRRHDANYVR
jgi:hypothetical protein